MNKKNFWRKVALLATVCLTMTTCGDDDDEPMQDPNQQEQQTPVQEPEKEEQTKEEEPKGPICTPSSLTMKAAIHEIDCEAYITVANDSACTFKSENEYVAVVDSATGFVKSRYCGKTNIIVTGETGTTKVPVNVNPLYNTYTLPTFGWNVNFNKVKQTYGAKAFESTPVNGQRRVQVDGFSAKAPYAIFVFDSSNILSYYGIITKKQYREETLGFLCERFAPLGDINNDGLIDFCNGFDRTNITTLISFGSYPQDPNTYDIALYQPVKWKDEAETRAIQLQENPAIIELFESEALKALEGIEFE